MIATLIVREHPLHRTGEAGAAGVSKAGCEWLAVKQVVKRLKKIGSVFPFKPSPSGVIKSIGAQFISELLDLAETIHEIIKNRSTFVAIREVFHFRVLFPTGMIGSPASSPKWKSRFNIFRGDFAGKLSGEYTMNQGQRGLCRALVLSCVVSGNVSLGFGQASDPKSSAVVDQIMTTALSRCYSTTADGVKKLSFVSATNEEFAEVEALGQKAIVPLARYLDLKQPKDDFTQLFAVKFLMAIDGPSTLGPLKRAFAQDQWEVTRAAALDGMYGVSRAEAKPYVEAALGDRSQLVRQRAHHLWSFYQGQIK